MTNELEFYKRAQENVIHFASKMDTAVNWTITVIGILMGLQWDLEGFFHGLVIPQLGLITIFLIIDSYRYKNLVHWKINLYQLQVANFPRIINKIDQISDPKYKIKRKYAIYRRYKKIYFMFYILVLINLLVGTLAFASHYPNEWGLWLMFFIIVFFFFYALFINAQGYIEEKNEKHRELKQITPQESDSS